MNRCQFKLVAPLAACPAHPAERALSDVTLSLVDAVCLRVVAQAVSARQDEAGSATANRIACDERDTSTQFSI